MFTGSANVFDSEEDMLAVPEQNKINKGDVIIIRYEGPKGGPGMPEMLTPTSAIMGAGLGNTRRIHVTRQGCTILIAMVVAVLAVGTLSGAGAGEPLVIVRAGEARTTIAHADNASKKVLAAAERLQSFLLKITGAKVPIRPWSESKSDASRILIGSKAVSAVGVEIKQEYPRKERIVVKQIDRDLVIAGNDAGAFQGTRHAVDRFLYELGCECFGPDPKWHVVAKRAE